MLQIAQKNLPNGRKFELEVTGFTDEGEGGFLTLPEFKNLEPSIQVVIDYNWAMYAEALEKGEEHYHNPINPQMGKTHQIYTAVQSFLSRRVRGRDAFPLNLYLSQHGRTSLDWHCGVDAFFMWEGVFATIDLSLRSKAKQKKGKLFLKADFLLSPKDLELDNLFYFAKNVAKLLKRRKNLQERAENKKQNREKSGEPIESIIQKFLEECRNEDLNYVD
ncbi:MAG: hypothetical protein EXS47_01490 [Candidatus Zambryskibacteria bacterium]|nr:hypothetical protein [Candidatus Zambryskibacteria bacterium]